MRSKHWTMRVAADDDLLISPNPSDNRLLNVSLLTGMAHVSRDAGDIQKLKTLPDMPDHEPARDVEAVALEIGLVSVNHKDALSSSDVPQDQPFSSFHSLLLYMVTPASLNVVVAYDKVEPVLLVEPVQQVKDATMRIPNIAKPSVLPQFVAISNFNVGKTFPEIVGQCVKEQSFVPGKGIGPAVVAPVTVAQKSDPARIIIENFLGRLKDFCQAPVCQVTPDIAGDSRVL